MQGRLVIRLSLVSVPTGDDATRVGPAPASVPSELTMSRASARVWSPMRHSSARRFPTVYKKCSKLPTSVRAPYRDFYWLIFNPDQEHSVQFLDIVVQSLPWRQWALPSSPRSSRSSVSSLHCHNRLLFPSSLVVGALNLCAIIP